VHIDPPKPSAHQVVGLNEREDFLVTKNRCMGEVAEKRQDLGPSLQRTTGEFAHDERMAEHVLLEEKVGELPVTRS
jgi:hypothetical protein